MAITVISHIYNEEYLLPFWLEYHSKIFNHGIIIDYCSTDNSVNIIKKFCPTWEIITTRNIKDGAVNFEAQLVDDEVNDIERRISGFKICLNTTEFLLFEKDQIEIKWKDTVYSILSYSVGNLSESHYPKSTLDFFKGITHFGNLNRGYRYLHSKSCLNYTVGRHLYNNPYPTTETTEMCIFHVRVYPWNEEMIKRLLQIQNNIPSSDKINLLGAHHIITLNDAQQSHANCIEKMQVINKYIKTLITNACKIESSIHYLELFTYVDWGSDEIMLNNDINLLEKTEFNDQGYTILPIYNYNAVLKTCIMNEINTITGKTIKLKNYHHDITEEEHKQILNSMPYKKSNPILSSFCDYLERTVSDILKEEVRIFNDDLWVRICRPSNTFGSDFNPCHRDVYLDFYRNLVNIYVPIIGSNQNSSLTLQPGSHLWNEKDTMVTKGGTVFKYENKKYSVDAIVASKHPLNMIRPDPQLDQMMIFSPYLIHGCADNSNDETRMSLEVRFIRKDDRTQENEFNEFLKIRNWR
jgi:hypothetical protein